MDELNILFTCVGRRVALLRAFRRAMGELGLKGKILGTDMTTMAAGMHEVDAAFLVPRAGSVEYMPAIEALVRDHGVGLIVPLTDLDLRALARRRASLASAGCEVMVSSEETIKLCRDKRLFQKHLDQANLPSIRTLSLSRFERDPFYPCVVKPLRGSGGAGSRVVRSSRELGVHRQTFGEQLLVQDFVSGAEYTIDVYRMRDGQVKAIVPRRRLLVRGGEVDQGVTVRDDQLMEATVDLVGAFDGLWGAFCCQCRRPTGERPRFFEVNARFGGGVPLSIAAGADLPKFLLQELSTGRVDGRVGQFTDRLVMLRYADAVFFEDQGTTISGASDAPVFQ